MQPPARARTRGVDGRRSGKGGQAWGRERAGEGDALARRLLDGCRLGLALLDGGGASVIANRAAEGFLGYGPGEMAGTHARRPLSARGARGGRARARAGRGAPGRARRGRRLARAAATARACAPASSLAAVAPAASAGAAGFTLEMHAGRGAAAGRGASSARGWRARRKRAQRAEEASRARDEFLATLSHELRTPLTAIMGWAHLLRTGNLDEASRERALETIERNAHLEAQLTADILDVARIITGKLRLQIQGVEAAQDRRGGGGDGAAAGGGQGASTLRLSARKGGRGAWPRTRTACSRSSATCSRTRSSSRPKGARCTCSVGAGADDVTIEVKDTGEGIPPEILPHMFERFRQGGARARGKGGLGLGLAIVSHIVGAALRAACARTAREPAADPRSPSQLPSLAERPVPGGGRPRRSAADPPPLHDVTVLVVDDQEDARELMCAVLGRCGAHVVAVDSTAAALEAMDRCRPDVDPERSRDAGRRRLFADPQDARAVPRSRAATCPAAALTAYARTEDRLHSLRAGFHRHVPKPVQPDELAEIVASLAARRR